MAKKKKGGPLINFNIEGDIAVLFEKCRDEASKKPEFWDRARMTKADFARHLLLKSLVEMGRELGVLEE